MATPRKSKSTDKTNESPADFAIQKTASCPTLGNGSKLTYEVGNGAEGIPAVRMTAAAGGGFFSREWISLTAIQQALDAWPKDRPLTSYALAGFCQIKYLNP